MICIYFIIKSNGHILETTLSIFSIFIHLQRLFHRYGGGDPLAVRASCCIFLISTCHCFPRYSLFLHFKHSLYFKLVITFASVFNLTPCSALSFFCLDLPSSSELYYWGFSFTCLIWVFLFVSNVLLFFFFFFVFFFVFFVWCHGWSQFICTKLSLSEDKF